MTNKELHVLSFLCKGYTNKEIGNTLNISQFTVKKHVSSIMMKLDARNRTEAVYIAVKQKVAE